MIVQSDNKENIDNASIHDMIDMLRQYEKNCIVKNDFSSAEQAKNKIQFLKTQEIILQKEKLDYEEKENIASVSKQGEDEVLLFQQHWDGLLKELLEALKDVELKLIQQHQEELVEIQHKLAREKPARIKYSSEVLNLRKHLTNLIKIKQYKQAQNVKNKIQVLEKEQEVKWVQKHEIKQKNKLETIKKKQQSELKALRIRLETTFNQKLKERDQKFQILLKRNRKRRIQSTKISREKLKHKTAILNSSKSFGVLSRF